MMTTTNDGRRRPWPTIDSDDDDEEDDDNWQRLGRHLHVAPAEVRRGSPRQNADVVQTFASKWAPKGRIWTKHGPTSADAREKVDSEGPEAPAFFKSEL